MLQALTSIATVRRGLATTFSYATAILALTFATPLLAAELNSEADVEAR